MTEPTDAKILFGAGVVKELGDNASTFPVLPFADTVLGTANELLKTTYLEFVKSGESGKGDFYNAEYSWKTKFLKTAEYVDTLADGDLSIINKSGFKPTVSNTTKSKSLSAMDNFKSHGNSALGAGVATSSVKSYAGLKAYLFIMAHKDAVVTIIGNQVTVSMAGVIIFSFMLNTKSSVNFKGLTSLTKMEAQAAGFNTAGIGALTQAVEVSIP